MKPNIGRSDKTIRLLLSVVILAAGVYFKSWWGLLAIVPLVTVAISFCPLYSFLGINTCEVPKKR
jgi:hypothetical protein